MEIVYKPIGVIHSPFKDVVNMPIQPTAARGVRGSVEVEAEFAAGLKDIDGFSHIILIYHLHLSKGYTLEVKPFLDDTARGVFATRAPKRPNPIGLSIVKLLEVAGNVLHIEEVDIVDGTPLLDIKPYVPEFDVRDVERVGWFAKVTGRIHNVKSDERFR